jgi:hypothetical protein
MDKLPWEDLDSIKVAGQLYQIVDRLAKRRRKQFPATAYNLRRAASGIGGKLARSSVPIGGTARQLRDRGKALKRARYVRVTLKRMGAIVRKPDADITAALEVVERVIALIEIGR